MGESTGSGGAPEVVSRPIAATMIDVGRPPVGASPRVPGSVFRVVTTRTDACPVVDGWVPSSWVIMASEDDPTQPKTGGSTAEVNSASSSPDTIPPPPVAGGEGSSDEGG
jgi:hypothetical protein